MSLPALLDPATLDRVVGAALDEDLGSAGDLTTAALFPVPRPGVARLVARQELILAGLAVAERVFLRLDPGASFQPHRRDGQRLERGAIVATIRADLRAILSGERTALNFLMRMCGIATAARAAVDEIAGTAARVLDTRKTAPGLRRLDKYAVACGGAQNHRLGLDDAVMIKDTHLAAGGSIAAALARALAAGHPPSRLTVEVGDLDQLRQALEAGARRVLLDNMDVWSLRRAVALNAGRALLEASGGLRPGALRPVAETGVDFLSLGWLTHSAPAADLALDVERGP